MKKKNPTEIPLNLFIANICASESKFSDKIFTDEKYSNYLILLFAINML